jgi:hypothetical protein
MADAPAPIAATATAATPAAPTPTAATPAPAAVPSAAPAAPAAAVAAPAAAPAQPSTAAPEPAAAAEPSAEPAAPVEAAPDGETPSLLGEAAKPAPEPAKADAPAPDATAPVPETPAPVYEFTWPEGATPIPAEELAPFTGILGEAKVAPEVGQKLMDLYIGETQKLMERLDKQHETTWNETRRDEQKAELRQVFNLTGAGDHPAVVRLIHNISKKLLETSRPVTAERPVPVATTRAQRRYAGSINGAAS